MITLIMLRYFIFNKPYGVLSQFTSEPGQPSLKDFDFPEGIYPAGRLDKDSEGLMLLTNDGPLIEKLLNPKNHKPKTYWALVERMPSEQALEKMRNGLKIEDYQTKPCKAQLLTPQPTISPRNPPVRFRKNIQDFWIEVTLIEGKNRQLRKMTAAIGHPTLRLMRIRMANLTLNGLELGQWREINRRDIEF